MIAESRRWLARNSLATISMLMVVGVLLLSFVLPTKASQTQQMLLVASIVGAGGLLILLRKPQLGLIALIVVALLARSPRLPGELNIAIVYLAMLIGLWLLRMVAGERRVRLLKTRTIWPLLALVLSSILSFGVGQLPWFTVAQPAAFDAQIGGVAIFVLSAGAFLLVAYQIREVRWLRWMTWLFIGVASLHILGRLVPGISTQRLFRFGTTSHSLFWVWLVVLAFSQAFLNRRLHVGWRAALMGLVVATLYVALVRGFVWKSGWIPPLIAMAVIVGMRHKRVAILILLLAIVPAINIGTEAIAADEQYSYTTRIDAWLIGFEIFKINPIFGLGPANYYWYTPFFPIRGYNVVFNSHSQYLDIALQTGLIGLACFLWFFAEVGLLAWRLRDRVQDGFARAYIYGGLGGLVGMLVASVFVDWVLPFVYNIGLHGFRTSMLAWAFLGGIVAIEQMYLESSDQEAETETALSQRSIR